MTMQQIKDRDSCDSLEVATLLSALERVSTVEALRGFVRRPMSVFGKCSYVRKVVFHTRLLSQKFDATSNSEKPTQKSNQQMNQNQ